MDYAVSSYSSYRGLIDHAGVTVLPKEILNVLIRLEIYQSDDEQHRNICLTAYQQYTVPLFIEERPLLQKEINGLRYVRELFSNRVKHLEKVQVLERELLELLDKHRLGR